MTFCDRLIHKYGSCFGYEVCIMFICAVDLPSIAGMSPLSMALLVKGAFCSTTANRGGIRDCRPDRNMCNLCSSKPWSPCWRNGEQRGKWTKKKKKKRGWGSEDTCINSKNSFSQHEALTLSSFSIRANKEGISAVCSMPSSVVQAAKAGIKTWWTALTTRSDGSARESSISSKPCTCEGFEI